MCGCAHTYLHIHVHTCTHVYTHVDICIYVNTHTHMPCKYTHTLICPHIYTIYTHAYVIYKYACTHIKHVHTYICTHTYLYIYLFPEMVIAGDGKYCLQKCYHFLCLWLCLVSKTFMWQFVPEFPSLTSFSQLSAASVLDRRNPSHIVLLEDTYLFCVLTHISSQIVRHFPKPQNTGHDLPLLLQLSSRFPDSWPDWLSTGRTPFQLTFY